MRATTLRVASLLLLVGCTNTSRAPAGGIEPDRNAGGGPAPSGAGAVGPVEVAVGCPTGSRNEQMKFIATRVGVVLAAIAPSFPEFKGLDKEAIRAADQGFGPDKLGYQIRRGNPDLLRHDPPPPDRHPAGGTTETSEFFISISVTPEMYIGRLMRPSLKIGTAHATIFMAHPDQKRTDEIWEALRKAIAAESDRLDRCPK
ncbi:MAG: hypothetical protein HOO96_02380 [Polyangiaceae bacterium]|nr:hypothetical protein [Polyangiaceae bacterium]